MAFERSRQAGCSASSLHRTLCRHDIADAQMLTAKSIDKLADDLAEVIELVKGDPDGLNAGKGDMVALYGTLADKA